jgi:hypothetical protein
MEKKYYREVENMIQGIDYEETMKKLYQQSKKQ